MKKILFFSCIIVSIFFLMPRVSACTVGGAKIDSVSPSEITPGETEVTINGSGFNDDIQDSKVYFDAYNTGTIISWSNNQISVRAPSPLYLGNLRVSICCGWQCQATPFYDITLKPKISYLSVNSIMPGEKLFINGNNFGSNQGKVYIGGQQINITQWSLVNATIIIPNLDSGNVSVEVETSKGIKSDPVSLTIKQPCNSDTWSCGNWTTCSSNGSQTRSCNKTNDCATADTPSPTTAQSCTPPAPTCTQDTWSCGAWDSCSLSGIQNRSCTKTFDCPDIQTGSPITDQYCEAPSRPRQTPPSVSDEILDQDAIIKSTVKLLCPVDAQKASQGSGTIIDSTGIILTNKHVIAGTLGCLVGFIDSFNDEPYFGERQIADIFKLSPNQDVAILKIRNSNNIRLPYIDMTKGSVNFPLGTKITTYGYPAKFGTKITYTSGDFSGTDGSYLKTTAILEYGNSGGGAYLKNGAFIGIPSAVVKGQLNAMGYLLSVDTIKAWLNNSSATSESTNNEYSRVSVLENIDLNKLDSLKLFIPDVDDKGDLAVSEKNKNSQNTKEQPQEVQTQKKSNIIESPSTTSQANEQGVKVSWFGNMIGKFGGFFKKIFNWF